MACHISFRSVTFVDHASEVVITVVTDVPCILRVRVTDQEPRIHKEAVTKRGLPFKDDVRFCFTVFSDTLQDESGEVTVHTFTIGAWSYCQTKWLYLWGTRSGEVCVSTSPVFKHHNGLLIMNYTLKVMSCEHGAVTVPGEGTFVYAKNSVVPLLAVPDAFYHFIPWWGNTENIDDPTSAATHIDMLSDAVILALFEANVPVVFTRRVAASTDDAHKGKYSGTWFFGTGYGYTRVGDRGNNYSVEGDGMRFLDIAIPPGSTITGAKLTFYSSQLLQNVVVRTKIRGQKSLVPATFSTLADFNARPFTTAVVLFDGVPPWSPGVLYDTIDFSAVVQEIINQAGWTSGNPMVIFWDDWDARSTLYNACAREAVSFDSSPANAPLLTLSWIPP